VNANLVSAAYAKVNGLDKLVTEGGLFMVQLKACAITIVLSVVATLIITIIVKVIVGLRPTPEEESIGLDLSDHGEAGYEH
jgi:Amt family ammonium transporter